MRMTRLILLLAAIAASPIYPCAQANRAPRVTNPGAIVTFVYCDAAPDPALCATQNRVRNDYAQPYVNGQDGVSAVFNLLSGSKDLTIGLNLSSRSVWFDFTDRIAGSAASPTWWTNSPVQSVQPYFNVLKAYRAKELCTTDPCEVDFVTAMNAGQWRIGTTDYATLWNPGAVSRPVNSPETSSTVNVHFHKNAGEEQFTVTPVANNHGLVVAGLESTNRKTVTSSGQYIMPFTMTVKLQ